MGFAAAILAMVLLFAGCGQTETKTESSTAASETEDETLVHVLALKGPTSMGMVKMMSDNDSKESPADTFELAAAPDEVSAKLVQGEVDIAAVPANLASVLYNKTNGGVQVLAVNTLGVLYIVEDGDTVHSIADLKGRTIYAGGKGATPEYALNYILEKNGLVPGEDVTIEWKSEHAECVAALAEDADGIAMLPQPFVTTAQTKKETLRTALDLTEEWNKVQESEGTASTLVTGVTVVRTAFAKEHPEAVADFMEAYRASVSYVTENTDEAAKLIGDYDIVPEAVAKKALPACNIVCITGDEMKEKLSGYLGVLKDQNPEQSEENFQEMTSIIPNKNKKEKQRKTKLWPIVFWLMIWQAVSVFVGQEILLASPAAVLKRLFTLVTEPVFWQSLLFSGARIGAGFLFGAAAGIAGAALAGRFPLQKNS